MIKKKEMLPTDALTKMLISKSRHVANLLEL